MDYLKACSTMMCDITDDGLAVIHSVILSIYEKERFLKTTSEERRAELREEHLAGLEAEQRRKEAFAAEAERRKQKNRDSFRVYKDCKLKGLEMPDTYEFSIGDLQKTVSYIEGEEKDFDSLLDALDFFYCFGFKRGMKYGTAKANKKGQATI